MNECIEIEHSEDYTWGFDNGIESFRPKFMEMKERFDVANADLTSLINRAFLILEEDEFFKLDNEGFWHSGLHRDMKKVIDGNPFKDRYTLQNMVIDDLNKKIKELEAPKTCDGCKYIQSRVIRSSECFLCSRELPDRYKQKDHE